MDEEKTNARITARISGWRSGGTRTISRFDMSLNHFSRRILASAAAAGDGQLLLHFVQRAGAAIHDFANLAITDGIAQANVHGAGR